MKTVLYLIDWLVSKYCQTQLQLLSQHTMRWPYYSGNKFCVLVRAFKLYTLFERYLANRLKSQTREKHREDMSRHISVHIPDKLIFQIGKPL